MEDNEDILIGKRDFSSSMETIFGEDNADIWDQIYNFENELYVEQADKSKVSIKKLIEIMGKL